MKYYVVLGAKNEVVECIPEIDEVFPGVPIEERYAPDFLSKCIVTTEVKTNGYIYDAETGEFNEPPAPEPTPQPEPEPEPDPEPSELEKLNERMDNLEAVQDTMMEGLE